MSCRLLHPSRPRGVKQSADWAAFLPWCTVGLGRFSRRTLLERAFDETPSPASGHPLGAPATLTNGRGIATRFARGLCVSEHHLCRIRESGAKFSLFGFNPQSVMRSSVEAGRDQCFLLLWNNCCLFRSYTRTGDL